MCPQTPRIPNSMADVFRISPFSPIDPKNPSPSYRGLPSSAGISNTSSTSETPRSDRGRPISDKSPGRRSMLGVLSPYSVLLVKPLKKKVRLPPSRRSKYTYIHGSWAARAQETCPLAVQAWTVFQCLTSLLHRAGVWPASCASKRR